MTDEPTVADPALDVSVQLGRDPPAGGGATAAHTTDVLTGVLDPPALFAVTE